MLDAQDSPVRGERVPEAARHVLRVLLHEAVADAVHVEVDAEVEVVLVARSGDVRRDRGTERVPLVDRADPAVERRAGQPDAYVDAAVQAEDVVGGVDVVPDPSARRDHELAAEKPAQSGRRRSQLPPGGLCLAQRLGRNRKGRLHRWLR